MSLELSPPPTHLAGTCNVCGNQTKFYYTDPALYRESLNCDCCLTISRYRSIARGLLRAIHELTGVEAASLTALGSCSSEVALSIYDTQVPFYYQACAYPLPDLLAQCQWIQVQTSLYRPNTPLGASLGAHTTNQNLEQLTFADNSFDIVITSDVLEHVRLDDQAHREIQRVLKPGGIYLFTVPHLRDRRETIVRVAVTDPADPSKDLFLMEKEFHGDANAEDGQVLSYRAYGTELDEQLAQNGFEVDYCRQDVPANGIMNTELFYCRLTQKGKANSAILEAAPTAGSHLTPGTAQYNEHIQEEIEHFSALFEGDEARKTLFYKVPTTWGEIETRAAAHIRQQSGADMPGHVSARLKHRPGVRMLSLGSGPGGLEIDFAQQARQAEIVCMDVNPQLLELGQQRADELGLNMKFELGDLNTVELPVNEFDLVFCHAALHHVIELERLAEQIKQTLRPEGELITVDVITRNGFLMWPETKLAVQALWQSLPARFRLNHTGYAEPRLDDEIWEADTSAHGMECARSEEILPILEQTFKLDTFVPYYSISRRFFDTMYGPNFDLSQPLDRALLNWIWELDLYYLTSSLLRPETFFGIYRKE
jgi:ubiquinone/menaquinone biosynthesis C-methylase UbiE